MKKDTTPQRREITPRVPVFTPQVRATYDLLNSIVNDVDACAERKATAYAALTKLCSMWAPDNVPGFSCRLAEQDFSLTVNELIWELMVLFPGGVGLPDPHCDAFEEPTG